MTNNEDAGQEEGAGGGAGAAHMARHEQKLGLGQPVEGRAGAQRHKGVRNIGRNHGASPGQQGNSRPSARMSRTPSRGSKRIGASGSADRKSTRLNSSH